MSPSRWKSWTRDHYPILAEGESFLGVDAGIPVRVELAELGGVPHLVLTARVASEEELEADVALRLNARLTAGALVVEKSDRLLRRLLPLAEVDAEALYAAVDLVAREGLGVFTWLRSRAPARRTLDVMAQWAA